MEEKKKRRGELPITRHSRNLNIVWRGRSRTEIYVKKSRHTVSYILYVYFYIYTHFFNVAKWTAGPPAIRKTRTAQGTLFFLLLLLVWKREKYLFFLYFKGNIYLYVQVWAPCHVAECIKRSEEEGGGMKGVYNVTPADPACAHTWNNISVVVVVLLSGFSYSPLTLPLFSRSLLVYIKRRDEYDAEGRGCREECVDCILHLPPLIIQSIGFSFNGNWSFFLSLSLSSTFSPIIQLTLNHGLVLDKVVGMSSSQKEHGSTN